MQFREDGPAKTPPFCPEHPGRRLHRHGCYGRYADCDTQERDSIQRYICARCGRTFSVLPQEKLPYLALSTSKMQADFDAVASGTDPPPHTVREQGCLRRAWKRLAARVEPLRVMFGQMISTIRPDTGELWSQMRQYHNLAGILRFLFDHFKTSLLADYQCLRP
jgi:transposase-like protein